MFDFDRDGCLGRGFVRITFDLSAVRQVLRIRYLWDFEMVELHGFCRFPTT